MKQAKDLKYGELIQLVDAIQIILWRDSGYGWKWNPNKEWDSTTADAIARFMREVGLGPEREG